MKKSFLTKTIILSGSLLLQLGTFCFQSRGAAGDVDLSFDPGSGVNGPVHAVALQPDGKVLISGDFTTVKGLVRANLARLNADGSGDSGFNAGEGAWAGSSIVLQPDGKMLVGNAYYGISRLNSDGSLDTSFNAVLTPGYGVGRIAVQPDGKVLIAGAFNTVNGTNRDRIARLNANGSLDSGFNAGIGTYGGVGSIALQPDGKVLIGGNFGLVEGTELNGIARLNSNGSLDATFNPDTQFGVHVGAIVIQPDGKVLMRDNYGLTRLKANGNLDNSFSHPGSVYSFALQPDGRIIFTGNFPYGIARLNANGSLDGSFDPGTGVGVNESVFFIALQPDSKVLISGGFSAVNGTNRNRIARLNADGSLDGSFDSGKELDGPYSPLEVQPDGKVLIAGLYIYVNSTNGNGRIRLNADGSQDTSFIPPDTSFNPALVGLYSDYVQDVFAGPFVQQSDGKVILGGDIFYLDGGGPYGNYTYWRNYFVARFNADGSRDPGFVPMIGGSDFELSVTVRALAVQTDGKVVVGGTFAGGIARLNPDGSLDGSFSPGTGVNGSVLSIVLQSDDKMLIGGSFTTVNGTSRNRFARLNANGNLDASFDPGDGANDTVFAIVLQPDGKVLVGGDFTAVNGTNRNRIARLNSDGTLNSNFNPGIGADGSVRSIALQPDGKVLIGGDFLSINGVVRPHVARLYGDAVAPSLSLARSNGFAIISWPTTGLNFQLQETTNVTWLNSWSPVLQPAVTNAGQISVSIPASVGSRFFRLESQ